MIVTRACPDDVDVIMAWRQERTTWLAARGEDQWSIPLPRSAVSATVLAGLTWMVWDVGEASATITLTRFGELDQLWKPDQDPESLWQAGDHPEDAMYAAKMIVPLSRAGQGLGEQLLDWAAGRAFACGVTWLRLDAWTSNARLHAYYRRAGFDHVRMVGSRVSGACFQQLSRPYLGGWFTMDDGCPEPSATVPGPNLCRSCCSRASRSSCRC